MVRSSAACHCRQLSEDVKGPRVATASLKWPENRNVGKEAGSKRTVEIQLPIADRSSRRRRDRSRSC